MSEIKSVQCANFTAALGEAFRFCTLDDTGRPCGQLLTGKVQRIRWVGRKVAVDLEMLVWMMMRDLLRKEA